MINDEHTRRRRRLWWRPSRCRSMGCGFCTPQNRLHKPWKRHSSLEWHFSFALPLFQYLLYKYSRWDQKPFFCIQNEFAKWTQLAPSATSRANQAHDNMYGKGKKRCRSPLPSEIFQIHLQLMLKNRLKNLPRFVIIIGTCMPWCNRKFCALTGNQKIFCVSFLAHKVQLPYWLSFKLKTDGGSSSERSSVDARVSKRNYDRNILQKFSI